MTHDAILWTAFLVAVSVALVGDLIVLARKPHALSLREAAQWTAAWVVFAALVAVGVWIVDGRHAFLNFVTGYLIEWSLSMDNVFVFAALLTYFAVPGRLQPRVLFWGILLAAGLRLVFILAGVALLEKFEWMLYLFGGLLVVTGVRMAVKKEGESDVARNPAVRLARRFIPITHEYHDQRIFVVQNGRRHATPLFLAFVALALVDLMFAIDSVPAILAITRDTFVVFSSNMCAILGLRALYFLLGGLMTLFRFLHVGLGVILFFVGTKMLIEHYYAISTPVTLGVVFLIIGASIVASVLVRERASTDNSEETRK